MLAVVAALAYPAISSARTSAQRAKCLSNQHQIGTAIHLYAADHDGILPATSHTTGRRRIEESWIYEIAGYLGDVDSVRVCPADSPARQKQILDRHATSYVLNDMIFDSPEFNRLSSLPEPSRTLIMFTLSEDRSPSGTWDHAHCAGWSSWRNFLADVEADRFRRGPRENPRTGGDANYLYADGHASTIPAAGMKSLFDTGVNPAVPGLAP